MRKVPGWDKYFMLIAYVVAQRSKDPNTQVGCVIIDTRNRIIGTGFNGFPSGMKETKEMWQKPKKYNWVSHAEASALLYTTISAQGATLYTTQYPCQECAKLIASAGIKKVLYSDNKYQNGISEKIFKECKIQIVRLS